MPLKFNNKIQDNLDIKIPAHIAFIYKPKLWFLTKEDIFYLEIDSLGLTVDYDIEFMKTNLL